MSDSATEPTLELLVITADGVLRHPLPRTGSVSVGRENSELVIADRSVSRQHAVFHVGERVSVEDLGGSNGTALRRSSLPQKSGETENLLHLRRERADLMVGDRILLGTVQVVLSAVTDGGSRPSSQEVSAALQSVYALAEKAAKSQLSILIQGETGAGKDVLARFVHASSGRRGPFVAINCAALPETLLEAELFGSEKGAFTGSTQARPGLFESAEQGTVFLDEVGELPLPTQAKLLRVLEERKVLRVGGRTPRDIDVRFVSATNRDLERLSQSQTFREDLYFRINGVNLVVPPLRERLSEVPGLAEAFLKAACQGIGRPAPAISAQVLAALRAHRWPGNVRELKNVIERAALFCEGEVLLPEHLPARLLGGAVASTDQAPAPLVAAPAPGPTRQVAEDSGASPMAPLDAQMERVKQEQRDLERERIRRALDECGGNQKRAAELLGMSRRTLINRLNQLDLPRPRK